MVQIHRDWTFEPSLVSTLVNLLEGIEKRTMIQRLGQLLYLPVVIFGVVYLTAPYHQYLPELISSILQNPLWVLIIVGLLSAAFNRGKILHAILLLTMSVLYKDNVLNGNIDTHDLFEIGLVALIPINLALVGVLHETGVFSRSGALRVFVIVAQGVGIYYLSESVLNLPVNWINYIIIDASWAVYLPQSQPGFIIAVCSLLLVMIVAFVSPSPISNCVFGATFGYCLTIWLDLPAHIEGTFAIAIALLLAIGLLRDYYNMAYKDELTNLPQRRALKEQLMFLGRRYSLAMLDVDFFKKFNDEYGHDVGDQVLQMVAMQIRKVGGGGKAFRYGGEEFTVVFPRLDSNESTAHLEVLRKSIEYYEMVIRRNGRPVVFAEKSDDSRAPGSYHWAEKKVSVTISIGVASREPGERPNEVMKRADDALYEAKDAGRNCVKTA